MTSTPAAARRIVLIHTAGPWAGLWQICGLFEGLAPAWLPGDDELMHLPPDNRQGQATLRRSNPRAVYYREVPGSVPAVAPGKAA